LCAERSSPIQQQRARDAVPPRVRRDRSWRLHALRNNLELLLIGPAPPPTGFNNAEPFKLSTALIAVHKDCYTALNQIRQGGLHRRKTAGKTIKSKKRHILVDTVGLLLHAIVHPADIQDCDGGALVMATLFGMFPFLKTLFADSG